MNKNFYMTAVFLFIFSLTLFSQEEKSSKGEKPNVYDLIVTGSFRNAEKIAPEGQIKDALKELLSLNEKVAKTYESDIGKEITLTIRDLPMTGILKKIKKSTLYLEIKRGNGKVLMPVRIGRTPIDKRINKGGLSEFAKNICLIAKFFRQKNYQAAGVLINKTGDHAKKFQDSLVRKSNYFMPLFMACVEEDLEKIDGIIKKGGNVNGKCSAMVMNPKTKKYSLQTSTLLIEIIKKRKTKSVKHLVESGADVNAQNSEGVTPVMFTLTYYPDDTEVMEFLINNKSDLKHMDINGNTTLSGAVAIGRKDAVKLLLSKGVDPNEPTSKGLTPIMIAAMANKLEILKMLLEAGADIHKKAPKSLRFPKGFSIFQLDQSQMLPEIRNIINKNRPQKKEETFSFPGGVQITR